MALHRAFPFGDIGFSADCRDFHVLSNTCSDRALASPENVA